MCPRTPILQACYLSWKCGAGLYFHALICRPTSRAASSPSRCLTPQVRVPRACTDISHVRAASLDAPAPKFTPVPPVQPSPLSSHHTTGVFGGMAYALRRVASQGAADGNAGGVSYFRRLPKILVRACLIDQFEDASDTLPMFANSVLNFYLFVDMLRSALFHTTFHACCSHRPAPGRSTRPPTCCSRSSCRTCPQPRPARKVCNDFCVMTFA